ncbi:MAG: hypothetical protein HQK93_10410, partial [Nitrospirae bacterium]|nr:hypothetical protein [Nitrospirota bacterium]
MIGIIKKYLKYRPTIHDIICHIWIGFRTKISGFWGSIVFYIKAKFYGVECAGKVTCYGKILIRKYPFTKIIIGKNVSIISSSYRATASTIFAPTKLQTFTINFLSQLAIAFPLTIPH